MSIEEQSVIQPSIEHNNTAATGSPPVSGRKRTAIRLRKYLLSPLWLCLLLALAVRVLLVARTGGVVNGDEALVGIQAQHILSGEFPLYYYGQPYMGSLEAYLIAIIFAIAGSSVWTLRIEPILVSLLVVWLTWKLAAILADFAHLPPYARTIFQTIAALFAAVPPLYDAVLELRTLGGYVETFALMLLLLISALQLTRRWHAGATRRELVLRWAGIGFITGLGFWVNPLIISAVLTAATWILAFFAFEVYRAWKLATAAERQTALRRHTGNLLLVIAGIPAALIGGSPAIIWGWSNNWQNISYLTQISRTGIPGSFVSQHIIMFRELLHFYMPYVAPHVIGGSLPVENATLATIFAGLFALALVVAGVTALLVCFSFFWPFETLARIRRLTALPLLFAGYTVFVYCTSSIALTMIPFPQLDLSGRYGAPVMLALPFFFAALGTFMSMAIHAWKEKAQQHTKNSAHRPDAQATSPAPTSNGAARPVVALVLQGILVALMTFCLLASALSYGQADPDYTFQSPSCQIAPVNDAPIIAYLQQQHVHYAWAMSWIGYPITFKTQGQIVFADPRIPANVGTIYHLSVRMPTYQNAVVRADRPAILTFIKHSNLHPQLLQVLDNLGITYQARRFPSQPGTDVLIITSLSRTFTILSNDTYRNIFHNCF